MVLSTVTDAGARLVSGPGKPENGSTGKMFLAVRLPALSYSVTVGLSPDASVLMKVMSVVESRVTDTLGKIRRGDGVLTNSAPSMKFKPASNRMKKPLTAGVDAASSTHPVLPDTPAPKISLARRDRWPDAGVTSVTGMGMSCPEIP